MNPHALNAHERKRYAKTIDKIRDKLGSYHSIALRIFHNSDIEVTGETVRAWFIQYRIPVDIAFILHELMDGEIDPLTLTPWLAKHVEMKRPDAS